MDPKCFDASFEFFHGQKLDDHLQLSVNVTPLFSATRERCSQSTNCVHIEEFIFIQSESDQVVTKCLNMLNQVR